ncbi:MAG TPA: NAD-binding protein, partial [Thermoanaerobaculia bacterium]|nr:NAD-binding protein [Thermoanaerobaculia bacterium]
MLRSQKRLLMLLGALPVLLVSCAYAYMLGMRYIEGRPRTFWRSFEFVAETLSTTGYGADFAWSHPTMVVFVVLLQFAGVFLIFLIFPVYLIPFLEERFEARLPTSAGKLRDHVIVYRYGPPVASFLEEAAQAELATVVIEPDATAARRLIDKGVRAVYGDLDDGVLERVGLSSARALVANGGDDENAALILASRQAGFEGDVIAFVEEPSHRQPILLAGATAAYTPRHILGAALAARASERLSPTLSGVQRLGDRLEISEIRIAPGSSLAGKSLAASGIGEQTGATVIGQWVDGRLVAPAVPGMRLEPNGILIVVGSSESVSRVNEIGAGAIALRRHGPVVVGGYGEVGSKVVELLREAEEEVFVVDRRDLPGVDKIGDLLDRKVLEQTPIAEAKAVVLALDSDSANLFATVIVKNHAPSVPVIARVNQAENVERIHAAGAEFALAISQVSGGMLTRRLLGEEAIAVDPQLKLMRVA